MSYINVTVRNVDVEIDIDDIVEDLSASERQQLLVQLTGGCKADDLPHVQRAYEALMANRPAEALAYLESFLHPAIGGFVTRKNAEIAKARQ